MSAAQRKDVKGKAESVVEPQSAERMESVDSAAFFEEGDEYDDYDDFVASSSGTAGSGGGGGAKLDQRQKKREGGGGGGGSVYSSKHVRMKESQTKNSKSK